MPATWKYKYTKKVVLTCTTFQMCSLKKNKKNNLVAGYHNLSFFFLKGSFPDFTNLLKNLIRCRILKKRSTQIILVMCKTENPTPPR